MCSLFVVVDIDGKKYDKSNNKFNLNTFQKLNAHVVVDYRDTSDITVDYVYTMSA